MRLRASFTIGCSLPLLWLAAEACSGSSGSAVGDEDGGASDGVAADSTFSPDVGSGGGGGGGDATGADVREDVDASAPADAAGDGADASNGDATADAGSDAATGTDADAGVDGAVSTGERVSPGCPVGLALTSATLYWTENGGVGCAPAVRACPTSGCATLPSAIYSGTSGQSLPIGVAAVAGTPDDVFFADDQIQHANLWKMQGDGGALTAWGTSAVAPAPAVTDGTNVYWGSADGIFRTPVATSGATKIVSTAPDSISPQAIAVDATNVYVATGGNVIACPKTANCSDGSTTATILASATGVQSMFSDGTTLFFTASSVGHDKLYRCPIGGCASATPVLFADTSTSSASQQFGTGVTANDTDVYWGTTSGFVYVCAKSDTAPCTPTPWVTSAKPIAMVRDTSYVYWSDTRGGVYRVRQR